MRQKRNLMKKAPLNWFVTRNRLSPFKNKNKQTMEELLRNLAERVHFRIAGNITERVIFRELFLKGLTMMDLRENGLHMPMSMSNVAARQEVRSLARSVLS